MRCLTCGRWSFGFLCSHCKEDIKPQLSKRELDKDFFVYSFFAYHDIKPLLHTKHHACGAYVYKILARKAFGLFFETLKFDEKVALIPIDDKIKNGYSHTAILAHEIKNRMFLPYYGSLRSQNSVSYSGKTLSYRKSHPRDFLNRYKENHDIILMDDLVTSGTTLLEAKKVLKKADKNVLFGLTLADAKVK